MNDLISVIVPVYKVEEYLEQCLQSIVNQTYTNLEIILVDDGSPDSCPSMCDEWATHDSRITVIHKENGGLSDARNFGTVLSVGHYISYIDSDDLIHQDMYIYLLKLAHQYNAEIIDCAFQQFDSLPFDSFDEVNDEVIHMDSIEAEKALLDDRFLKCTAWNKLVKSDIAKQTPFDFGVINEDVLWSYRIIKKAKRIIHTNRKLYAYYQRADSIMHVSYSKKRFDGLNALQQKAKEIQTDFPDLYPRAERSYLGACMYHYQLLCRLEKKEEYELFKRIIHKRFLNGDLKTVLSIAGLKQAIWYSLFVVSPNLTCSIRNWLKIGL